MTSVGGVDTKTISQCLGGIGITPLTDSLSHGGNHKFYAGKKNSFVQLAEIQKYFYSIYKKKVATRM